jgi:hypothetical protein
MQRGIRLWQRDVTVENEVRRSPLTTGQIARLLGFSSRKKAAERACLLYRAGLLKRVPHFHPAMQGKPEFVYFVGARPQPRTLSHTIAVSEARVVVAEWLRTSPEYAADFYYAHEVQTSGGLIPDATLVLRKAERTALFFFELDNGTEVITRSAGYSLAGKLRSYASYFDAETYKKDFGWTGPLQGFRVALIIVQPERQRHVQHLVAYEHHDFVLTTTFERFKEGLHRPVWMTHDGTRVDLLGRPGDLHRDLLGEIVGPPIPTKPRYK